MPAKSGRIVGWGRHGSKFTEAFLEGGERVELSDEALAVVRAHDLRPPTNRSAARTSEALGLVSPGSDGEMRHARREDEGVAGGLPPPNGLLPRSLVSQA
jgi:hypothetical protein